MSFDFFPPISCMICKIHMLGFVKFSKTKVYWLGEGGSYTSGHLYFYFEFVTCKYENIHECIFLKLVMF